MKNVWWAFVIGLLLWGAQSCQRACRDIECRNGGRCVNGQCRCEGRWSGDYCDTLCPIGLEGRYCATVSSVKFIRTWNATTTSPQTGTLKHPLYVTAGTSYVRINISNFNNEGYTVVGTMLDYNRFEIYSQNATGSYTGKVEGSGYLNEDKLAINLTKQGIDYFANCNK